MEKEKCESDNVLKAKQILLNIKDIYEGNCEKDIIDRILFTQYNSLPLINNLLIHNRDTFDNDFLFYTEIEKEFKYILSTGAINNSKTQFHTSMNYYLSVFLLPIIDKETRFVKECFILIMEAYLASEYDTTIIALQITFFQTLIKLLEENGLYKEEEIKNQVLYFKTYYRNLLIKVNKFVFENIVII